MRTRVMEGCTRRTAMAGAAAVAALAVTRAQAEPAAEHRDFIAEAFRMRDEAVRLGDQPFGAVVVKDGRIIGYGPSRVVLKRDPAAHAEREAIREAQARIGSDLSGAILYSSSRPCAMCEAAAAESRVARMIHGSAATDAGAPR